MNTMTITSRTLITMLVALLAAWAACAEAAAATPLDRLSEASALYERGIEARGAGDETAARAAFDLAAQIYEELLSEAPESASLRRNLALAHINASRLGWGIVELRRAQLLAAGDRSLRERIRTDLAAARARVLTPIEPISESAISSILERLAWPPLLFAGIVILTIGWSLVLWRIIAPKHAPGTIMAVTAIVGGGFALALALTGFWSLEHSASDRAVLVAEETTARVGPSETGFPAAFDRPLTQGIEVRIIDRRSAWVAASLPDGKQVWLPADSIEFIRTNP